MNENKIESQNYYLNLVELPENEKREEWIAYNIFSFHKQACMLFGTLNELCNCPKFTAINLNKDIHYEYVWSDKSHNQISGLSASQHTHLILDWIQEQLDDEDIFPINKSDYPDNFIEICQLISKRMLRVYAHIYHHHHQHIKSLNELPQFNTNLKHFIYFIQHFSLVSPNELKPLSEFIKTHNDHDLISIDYVAEYFENLMN